MKARVIYGPIHPRGWYSSVFKQQGIGAYSNPKNKCQHKKKYNICELKLGELSQKCTNCIFGDENKW